MKKEFRLIALSALVMTALGFSVIGAMALTPVSRAETQSASATPESANEVVGVVSAMDAGTITVDGTVYNLVTFTKVEGSIQVGDTVKLELITNPDASLTVKEVNKTGSTSGPSMDATSTEPVSTETASPDHDSSRDMNGSNPGKDNGNGSSQGNSNESNLNNNNGSSRDNGNRSSQDFHNGQGHDSGSGPGNSTGNNGN